jgi:RecA-family ATPase
LTSLHMPPRSGDVNTDHEETFKVAVDKNDPKFVAWHVITTEREAAERELERKQRGERRQGSDEHHAQERRALAESFAKRYWDFCRVVDAGGDAANAAISDMWTRKSANDDAQSERMDAIFNSVREKAERPEQQEAPEQEAPQPGQTRGAKAARERWNAEKAAQKAAREEEEAPEIEWVRASDWHGKPVPERRWLVQKFIPYRNVTQHTGDGGVGKSLLDLQLAVAVVANRKWIGMTVDITGPVIVYSAEDELDETWRRVADICRYEDIELSTLGDLHIAPLAGLDAMLSVADDRNGGSMTPTPLWHQLVGKADAIRPKLVVIDTSADVFGGDEIKRRQVRQFVGILRGLAFDFDCAVVLLSHPSVAGINDGTGRSGSTGWNNAFRGRMYQERVTVRDGTFVSEPDPDLRVLRNNKLNYGRTGAEIRIRYDVEHNVFVNEQADEVSPAEANIAAENAFMACLAIKESQGRPVNDRKTGSYYAPKIFSSMTEAAGCNEHRLASAMERLFDDRQLHLHHEGKGSHQKTWISTKPPAEPVSEGPVTAEPATDTKLERAKQFLREQLAAGPVPSIGLYANAKEALISRTTLGRAAEEIGVKFTQDAIGTTLSLPS